MQLTFSYSAGNSKRNAFRMLERGINFVVDQYDFLTARQEFYSWVCTSKYCDSDLNIKHPKRTNIHKNLVLFHILKL